MLLKIEFDGASNAKEVWIDPSSLEALYFNHSNEMLDGRVWKYKTMPNFVKGENTIVNHVNMTPYTMESKVTDYSIFDLAELKKFIVPAVDSQIAIRRVQRALNCLDIKFGGSWDLAINNAITGRFGWSKTQPNSWTSHSMANDSSIIVERDDKGVFVTIKTKVGK